MGNGPIVLLRSVDHNQRGVGRERLAPQVSRRTFAAKQTVNFSRVGLRIRIGLRYAKRNVVATQAAGVLGFRTC